MSFCFIFWMRRLFFTSSCKSLRICEMLLPWYSSNFSREPAELIQKLICWSTVCAISDSVTSRESMAAWCKKSFWTAICSGIAQSGLPFHFMPSISPCRRICSTSDFKMGSSPTTQITSSTMLCSGIMAFLVATLSTFWRVCCACCCALAETPINKRVPMKPAMYFAPLFFIAFSICLFFIISLFNRFF